MYYAYPEAEEAYAARYQYFLGDQMIAAPIVFPADPATGLAAADVWVPEGQWIDYTTKETFTGPGWVRILGDLNRMPMLMRSGAILPLAASFTSVDSSNLMASGTTRSIPKDKLVLAVFPGPEGKFRLYEDDGESEAFKTGQYEWTEIRTRMASEHTWEITIAPVEGNCTALPSARSYEIRLEGSLEPQDVSVNGIKTDQWTYQVETLTTIINLPAVSKHQETKVVASGADSLVAIGDRHNLSLAITDAQRFLSQPIPEDVQSLSALLDFALSHDFKGKTDLVSRLGGPLVHFIEFVTLEETSQQLGRVIFELPKKTAGACDLKVDFTLAGEAVSPIHCKEVSHSLIINTPFAYTGKMNARQWQANVTVSWHSKTMTFTYQSHNLFPAVTTWHSHLYNSQKERSPIQLSAKNVEQLPTSQEWIIYEEDPSKVANLAYPFVVPLWKDSYQKIVEGQPIAGCMATTILAAADHQANLLFISKDPADFYVNGEKLPDNLVNKGKALAPFNMHPDMPEMFTVGMFHLKKGENTLVVDIHPIPGSRPAWFYIGMLTSPDGQIIPDLDFL